MAPLKRAFRVRRHLVAALFAVLLLQSSPRAISATSVPRRPAAPATKAPANSLTAILIVAQGIVADPNFGGSIVLVMNNLAPAPVGVIINRPTPIPVSRLFPKLKRLALVPDKVYFGGPVELREVWFLFRAHAPAKKAFRVCDGVYVSSSRALLLQLLSRKRPMQGLRIFLGHAGWAPGQLEMEIQGGAWAPKRAAAKSIFNPTPQVPWPSGHAPKGSI